METIGIMEDTDGAFFVCKEPNPLLSLGGFLETIFPDGIQEPVRWDKEHACHLLRIDRALKPSRGDLEALLAIFKRQG